MNLLRIALLTIAALAMAACGEPKDFTITGEVAGAPNMNLYVRYYGNGAVRTGVTIVAQGKFEIKESSKEPTIVELLDNEYRVLGRVYMQNGDKADIKLDRHNPYLIQVEGNEISHQWAQVLNQLNDSLWNAAPQTVNASVEGYIAQNPNSIVSSLLFATLYDAKAATALRADSVMQSIAVEARIPSVLDPYTTAIARFVDDQSYANIDSLVYRLAVQDSAVTWRPGKKEYTLLVLSNENNKHQDSITPRLKELMKEKVAKKMQVIDLSLASDTNSWKRQIKRDTATWEQAWMPGGVFAKGIDKLAIPDLPYYIVLDSAGKQLYRGSRYEDAHKVFE